MYKDAAFLKTIGSLLFNFYEKNLKSINPLMLELGAGVAPQDYFLSNEKEFLREADLLGSASID
jgi:hypothetical protein